MTRKTGWAERLEAVIDEHRKSPFEWVKSDCFTLPMDAAKAVTGIDPWEGERKYKGKVGAAKRLRKYGFNNVGDAFAAKFEEVPVSMMQRGDIGTFEKNGEVCGVVCVGLNIIGKSEDGLMVLPRSMAIRAFKVG